MKVGRKKFSFENFNIPAALNVMPASRNKLLRNLNATATSKFF